MGGMSAKIIPITAARGQRPERETLRFSIAPSGDLEIRPIREDGIVIQAYVVPDEHVDPLLRELLARRGRLKNARIYAAHPELRPTPSPKRRDICHRQRDGARRALGGCRRNAGHQGLCRDAHGDYTPAVCSHLGMRRCQITIAETGETWLTCSRCGERV